MAQLFCLLFSFSRAFAGCNETKKRFPNASDKKGEAEARLGKILLLLFILMTCPLVFSVKLELFWLVGETSLRPVLFFICLRAWTKGPVFGFPFQELAFVMARGFWRIKTVVLTSGPRTSSSLLFLFFWFFWFFLHLTVFCTHPKEITSSAPSLSRAPHPHLRE